MFTYVWECVWKPVWPAERRYESSKRTTWVRLPASAVLVIEKLSFMDTTGGGGRGGGWKVLVHGWGGGGIWKVVVYRHCPVRSVMLYVHTQRPHGLLGTGSPGRPPLLSHTSWALSVPWPCPSQWMKHENGSHGCPSSCKLQALVYDILPGRCRKTMLGMWSSCSIILAVTEQR